MEAKLGERWESTISELWQLPRAAQCPKCGQGQLEIPEADISKVPTAALCREDECDTWYFPTMCDRAEDGTLTILCCGWEGLDHWDGEMRIAPDSPDYGLWSWIVENPGEIERLTDKNMDELRKRYEREPGGA